jgi:hypothetical protein
MTFAHDGSFAHGVGSLEECPPKRVRTAREWGPSYRDGATQPRLRESRSFFLLAHSWARPLLLCIVRSIVPRAEAREQ